MFHAFQHGTDSNIAASVENQLLTNNAVTVDPSPPNGPITPLIVFSSFQCEANFVSNQPLVARGHGGSAGTLHSYGKMETSPYGLTGVPPWVPVSTRRGIENARSDVAYFNQAIANHRSASLGRYRERGRVTPNYRLGVILFVGTWYDIPVLTEFEDYPTRGSVPGTDGQERFYFLRPDENTVLKIYLNLGPIIWPRDVQRSFATKVFSFLVGLRVVGNQSFKPLAGVSSSQIVQSVISLIGNTNNLQYQYLEPFSGLNYRPIRMRAGRFPDIASEALFRIPSNQTSSVWSLANDELESRGGEGDDRILTFAGSSGNGWLRDLADMIQGNIP